MKKILLLFCTFALTSTKAELPDSQTNELTSLCGPIPAVCYPTTTQGGMGIFLVSFNQIYNPSSNPAMLEDFTCTDSTWLIPGLTYNFQATTGQTYEESLTAWIDFNNDGSFDPSEIVYLDSAVVYSHNGMIAIPSNVINTNTPLRMRVGSDYSGNPLLNGCNNALYGQYEDYTIYFGPGNGVNEKAKFNSITIAPNPFHTTAEITFDSSLENSELFIYNVMGCLVDQFSINSRSSILKRNGLPDGLYFYKIISEKAGLIAIGTFTTN
ncbi:hypothetical protein BH11BAC1_BH11BAC1_07400 [soil metagenome]